MKGAPRDLVWREAALAVEARLSGLPGPPPRRLDRAEVARSYPRRSFVWGWRVEVLFSDDRTRCIDVLATESFPDIAVRTALVDPPRMLTWPHVEADGVLCLLPNLAEVDPDDPAAVAENLLGRSCRLIEELLQGDIVERDFREEFITYWNYEVARGTAKVTSLLEPVAPSRRVHSWTGEGLVVVGESEAALAAWLERRFPDLPSCKLKAERAAFIWRDTPLVPAEYPATCLDLRGVADSAGGDAREVLEWAASGNPSMLVTIVGSKGRGGPGLVATLSPASEVKRSSRGMSRGFRANKAPAPLVAARFLNSTPLVKASVSRADAPWIHGRGKDERTARLLSSAVTIVGCGSLGGPVAVALAQAGVGKIDLVDPDKLDWPNVGRHPLGATSIGLIKVEEMAARLGRDFPHLDVTGHAVSAHGLMVADQNILEASDAVVCLTGSWFAEAALNRWHLRNGRKGAFVYGWTEPHGCAGHAVAITGSEGGCLQCGIGRTGVPQLRVTDWPDGGLGEEPACGAHYQPYGPVEIMYVCALIAETVLDCLLGRMAASEHRIWAARREVLLTAGGTWNLEWEELAGRPEGGFVLNLPWNQSPCAACASPLSSR